MAGKNATGNNSHNSSRSYRAQNRSKPATTDDKLEKILEKLKTPDEIKESLQNLEREVKKLKQDKAQQATKISQLEDVENLSYQLNANNLIVHGLKVNEGVQPETAINALLGRLNPTKAIPVANVKLLGKSATFMKFKTLEGKMFVLRSSGKLRQQISITEDLPPNMKANRNILVKKRRELLNAGAKSVKVIKNSLFVDDESWYDLNLSDKSINPRR